MTTPSPIPASVADTCPVCRAGLTARAPGEAPCPSCGTGLLLVQTSYGLRAYEAGRAAPVARRVIECVGDRLGANPAEITYSSAFIEDLNADSLAVVELFMGLEEEFDLTISDDDAQALRTVGDVIDHILRRPS